MAKEQQALSTPHVETPKKLYVDAYRGPSFFTLENSGFSFISRDCLSTNVHFKPKRVINFSNNMPCEMKLGSLTVA